MQHSRSFCVPASQADEQKHTQQPDNWGSSCRLVGNWEGTAEPRLWNGEVALISAYCTSDRGRFCYKLLTTSSAFSNCVSLPSRKASRDSSTETVGMIPLFSNILPCQVRYPATGNPKM